MSWRGSSGSVRPLRSVRGCSGVAPSDAKMGAGAISQRDEGRPWGQCLRNCQQLLSASRELRVTSVGCSSKVWEETSCRLAEGWKRRWPWGAGAVTQWVCSMCRVGNLHIPVLFPCCWYLPAVFVCLYKPTNPAAGFSYMKGW